MEGGPVVLCVFPEEKRGRGTRREHDFGCWAGRNPVSLEVIKN